MNTISSTHSTTRPSALAPHRVDLVALFFGVAFLAVGAGAIADQLDWVNVTGRAWMGAFLVTIGAVVVIGLLAAMVRQPHGQPAESGPSTE